MAILPSIAQMFKSRIKDKGVKKSKNQSSCMVMTQEERTKDGIWNQTLPPFVSLGQGHQAPNVRIKCLAVLLCLHSRELSNGGKTFLRSINALGKKQRKQSRPG